MFGLPDSFGWVGLRKIGVIPVSIVLMVIVIGLSYLVLSKTCFGRYIYAVGSNKEVAEADRYQCNHDPVFCLRDFRYSGDL